MKTKTVKKVLAIAALASALSACGSIYEKDPVGIGKDISEL